MEGLPELTLNTLVDELMVLCETIVEFKNLKDKFFDFSKTLELQRWKALLKRLTGPIYPMLVKQFWIHATATKDIITSFVMNRKIVVTEKTIAYLISHNGYGKRVYMVKTDARRERL